MAGPRALLPAALALLLAGCGGADVVSVPGSGGTVTVNPQTALLAPGGSATFTALVSGNKNQGVTWSVIGGSTNGAFSGSTGVYTAPATPGVYTVLATSAADTTKAGTGLAVVSSPARVTVSPGAVTLAPGATQQFSASLAGLGSQAVTWSVMGGDDNGKFTGTSGLYTAPSVSGTFTVLATSKSDPTQVGSATVTVNGPVSVRVSPSAISLLPGGTQTFTATVSGVSPTTVDWSVVEPGGGGITAAGAYTAPVASGAYTVKAVSKANGTSFGTAQVTVNAVGLTLSPPSATLDQGATQVFTPLVTGTGNTEVSWYLNGVKVTSQGSPYLFTAATAGTALLKAVSAAAPTVSATAVITVNPVVVGPLSPQASVVLPGGTVAFTAPVTGSTNKALTWSVLEGGAGGAVNASGVYLAPTGATGTDTVVATSAADATASAFALVTVGSVVISPAAPAAVANTTGTLTFKATVTGVADTTVAWAILPVANGGTISAAGYFTAPTQPGVYRVRATSVVNGALFSEVQVTVN